MISRVNEGTLIVALLQLGLDLLDGVQTHAHNDQDRGATEREV